MDAMVEDLGGSPELFPYMLDLPSDSVLFLRLKRTDYERASFLDARVHTPQVPSHALSWRQVAAAIEAAGLTERCGFIFHIGHVGSTLLSRLIGAHSRAFSLREPLLLRGFAHLKNEPRQAPAAWGSDGFEARLTCTLQLFSRTFEERVLPVVKASSFVSELSETLLSRASS